MSDICTDYLANFSVLKGHIIATSSLTYSSFKVFFFDKCDFVCECLCVYDTSLWWTEVLL